MATSHSCPRLKPPPLTGLGLLRLLSLPEPSLSGYPGSPVLRFLFSSPPGPASCLFQPQDPSTILLHRKNQPPPPLFTLLERAVRSFWGNGQGFRTATLFLNNSGG